MKQSLTPKGNKGNNALKFPFFPFSTSAGGKGNKGNNAYRLIPYSPHRIAGASA